MRGQPPQQTDQDQDDQPADDHAMPDHWPLDVGHDQPDRDGCWNRGTDPLHEQAGLFGADLARAAFARRRGGLGGRCRRGMLDGRRHWALGGWGLGLLRYCVMQLGPVDASRGIVPVSLPRAPGESIVAQTGYGRDRVPGRPPGGEGIKHSACHDPRGDGWCAR